MIEPLRRALTGNRPHLECHDRRRVGMRRDYQLDGRFLDSAGDNRAVLSFPLVPVGRQWGVIAATKES